MVLYFTSNAANPPAIIYMGKDKFENEDLIKYGFPEDVWYDTFFSFDIWPFHVDKLSSAHVYLRLQPGESWANIPQDLLDDCAQLVKANSIEGNKKNDITIIYTPWANLKKTEGMDTGQVTFHNNKQVKRVYVEKRANEIVNRLNKTKVEKFPDLAQEKIQRDKLDRQASRQKDLQQVKQNKIHEWLFP
ncbi:hypothetical protein K450DRAFT_173260 [Umbelopsis ramanniana AG]|uniref:NFACT RNA-binding domain-containing protein n=1 Tax=Umbelopsis ramanniana AG TaxID=1314678 RepID=A0AAD5HFL0_UMBRA|nr:uncharacterized protein K450DRAFT_173260 [Umbelopsis ramanniana AG]KAI8580801.1 hypothetical protein K450DRAFT_173260 [Umbelopsis ramanniana AG]